MGLFGRNPDAPTKINKIQINQSVLGYPVPVVMGKAKVQQSLLWVDGLTAKAVTQGGKGFGGGKGGSSYLYSADVIAALCNGPILGVGDVWSGQSWLSNNNTAETYTVAGATPSYTPANATSGVVIDNGVGMQNAYSNTQTDLGSGGAVTLAGTDVSPMVAKPFGTSLTSGQYSIDPSNNYHFSTADVGKTVIINYSFALNIIKQQEVDIVPAGKQIQVGGTFTFHQDYRVAYFTGPNDGKQLTKVSGTPTVTGTYAVSGSGPATYKFAPGDIGAEVQITYQIQNDSAIPTGAPGTLNFAVFEGTKGQAVWSLLTTRFPQSALGYTSIAYVAYSPMTLGYAADVQQNVFEVLTPDAYGSGIVDCNPVQCILQVLTNAVWGLGAGAVPFPTSAIDNGGSGSWGGPAGTPGARTAAATAWNWFAANSFFISPVIDHQDSAASVMSKWLEAGQCAAFMSEGLLKLVPYGDTSTAGNGATWTAPTAFAAALDDSCFVNKRAGDDPVKISSKPWQDAYNTVQVSWGNRSNQYSPEITPESDQAAINRYGSRIEDPQNWEFIRTLPAATFAASMRVKRNVYTRNTYEFSVPYAYAYLEPMDVVAITTSSVWALGLNNANLNITNLPVRIVKTTDNPDGTIDIVAEDYPFGVHQPTIFNKAIGAGQIQQNIFVPPGDTEAVLFEATNRLTGFDGNQIWIGAAGQDENWGSCNVLVSADGTTYKQVGIINKVARLGVISSLVNLLVRSEEFDNASWTKSPAFVTATANTDTDPLGGSTADKLHFPTKLAGALNDVQQLTAAVSPAITAGKQFTFSVWLRALTGTPTVEIVIGDNPSTWSATASCALTTSWQRFAITGTAGGGTNSVLLARIQSPLAPSVTSAFDIDAWGAQLEYGATANAYVKTGSVATTLANAFPIGSDPSTRALVVSLAENSAPLEAGTTADADSANTLCFVDGELISYSTCTAVGQDQYLMDTYIRRGQLGSTIADHPAGGLFLRLDDAVFKFTYDPTWAGKTLSFKFQSVNTFGNSAQDPSTLTPVSFTVPGVNPGTVDASSGIVLYTPQGPPANGGGSNVVTAVTSFSNLSTAPASGSAFAKPGWIMGQVYSAGGQLRIILPSLANANQGYMFNIAMNSGALPGTILKSSSITGDTNTSPAKLTTYASALAASITGWRNFAIYIGANGYLSLWLDGVRVADCQDTTYAPNPAAAQYGVTPTFAATYKLGPVPNAPGLGSTGLSGQGSIIPNQPLPVPSFTTATTSIMFSWSSQTMTLSDGSVVTVPSGTKAYTSLSSGTQYFFYPFIRVSDFTLQWANGTPPPTSASTAFAIAANSDGCFSMDPIQASTTSTGTGSGGGGSSCPEESELVDVQGKGQIAVGLVQAGDYIRGYSFQNKEGVYRKVVNVSVAPCAAWRVIKGHKISPCEPVWDGQAYTPAFRIPGAVFDGTAGVKVRLHVDTDDYEECNYYLVAGEQLLIHNFMVHS